MLELKRMPLLGWYNSHPTCTSHLKKKNLVLTSAIILAWERNNQSAVLVTACVSHRLMASGPKYWDTVETNKLCLGDRDVIGHKLADWEMFSGDKHVCLPVEQSDSSAAASNCVFPGGKLAFLACSHRTDVQWWRPEGWWGGVCQTSASGVIIKITPVVIAHKAKKEKKSQLESSPLLERTLSCFYLKRCQWSVRGKRKHTQHLNVTAISNQLIVIPLHVPHIACSVALFFLFDGLICYSDMQNIRLI